ncbi:virion protein [Mycobacterium phage 32HC]|uniref:Virion protein n=1 Tax=Mycobacterium phage 32HC TaxID=1445729 RepID=W8EAD8_9CAUD|nr:virion protein [Mycobacterium phage 32HC]AHJ86303.1 virion protein [Mycobacterium phage 32HC]
MTTIEAPGFPRPDLQPWSSLPPEIRDEAVTLKWIGSDGKVWPLAGLEGGIEGAFIAGDIDGLVHIPFDSIWTKPAYGPPRFQRAIRGRKEISFPLGLMSDSSLGWYDTGSRFWRGCKKDETGFFTVTTRRFGELYIPMQLLSAKCILADDPARQRFSIHDIILAVDGDPCWHRPDVRPAPFVRPAGPKADGVLRAVNRGTEPAWPIYVISAPGKVWLPDGPNAFTTPTADSGILSDWPQLGRLFGIPFIDDILQTLTRKRTDTNMIEVPELQPGEHAIIDTDPSHRLAITTKDPVDNLAKKFIRNSELLNWILGEYGDSGIPLLKRFKGQGFTIPIPPRSTATLPIKHSNVGGKIYVQVPQRYEMAVA